jgi:hypothetical protein
MMSAATGGDPTRDAERMPELPLFGVDAGDDGKTVRAASR